MGGKWKPEYSRAYWARKRLGVRSTHIATLSWQERLDLKVDRTGGLFAVQRAAAFRRAAAQS